MNQYEQLLSVIKEQSVKYNSESLKVGKMTGPTTCALGDLILESEDLYIAEHLTKKVCNQVDISLSNGKIIDNSIYTYPLDAGDLVVLYRLNDTKYLLLERVV